MWFDGGVTIWSLPIKASEAPSRRGCGNGAFGGRSQFFGIGLLIDEGVVLGSTRFSTFKCCWARVEKRAGRSPAIAGSRAAAMSSDVVMDVVAR